MNNIQSKYIPGPISDLYNNEDPGIDYLIFKVDAIREYVDNPKYKITYGDFGGRISRSRSFQFREYLLSRPLIFSYAYSKYERDGRALVLLAYELMGLDTDDQYRWIKFIENKDDYNVNGYFAEEVIYGNYVKQCSIYRAVLLEINTINQICDEQNIDRIFSEEYSFSKDDLGEFRVLFLPSKRNFNHFILTTNIIINDSMQDFYDYIIDKYNKRKKDVNRKIVNFQYYLENEIGIDELSAQKIVSPFSLLLYLRNEVAHELITDFWNESLWLEQDCFMDSLYDALRKFRESLILHYKSKVDIPEEIVDEKNIVHP
ncbi:hypothetical protein J6U76_04415 [bacterium]|nr:hypothetical protein [bacterium]